MKIFKTKEEVIETIINEKDILIVQDLDGVCIPLVQDPLKREINKEYVKDVSRLREKFAVLTCGEHEGRRGVNRLVEKALNSKQLRKKMAFTYLVLRPVELNFKIDLVIYPIQVSQVMRLTF